jgi:hypothetical protein
MGPGVWVVHHLVHLSLADDDILSAPAPGWVRKFSIASLRATPSVNMSVGFSAKRIAATMGIEVDELLDANRRGLLHVATRHVTARSGSEMVGVRFTFTCGEHRFDVVSAVAPRSGPMPLDEGAPAKDDGEAG